MTTSRWLLNDQTLIDPSSLITTLSLSEELGSGSLVSTFIGKANSFYHRVGRHYSEGWILANGHTIKAAKAVNDSFELKIYSEESQDTPEDPLLPVPNNYYNIAWLYAESYTAITPQVVPPADPVGDNTVETLHDDTVYLVHLVDQRFYASWTSLTNHHYNWVDTDGETINPDQSYQEILDDIWLSGLTNYLGLLDWAEAPQIELEPAQYRFTGQNAWEAFNDVLEDAGCIIAPQGDYASWKVFPCISEITLSTEDQDRFDALKKSHLIDSEGTIGHCDLPNEIRVYYHTRGQQYQLEGFAGGAFDGTPTHTPMDKWNEIPSGHEAFNIVDLITNVDLDLIISGTELPLWAPVIVYRDAVGALLNFTDTEELTAKLKDYATRYINTQLNAGDIYSWTFSGIHKFELSNVFTEISLYDYGEGIKTRLTQSQQFPKLPQAEYPGKPDAARQQTPHTRIAYVRPRKAGEQTPSAGTEAQSSPGAGIQNGTLITCDVLYHDQNVWKYSGGTIAVTNYFADPLREGSFYHCHFNYQASSVGNQTGQWYFLSGGSGGTDALQQVAYVTSAITGRLGATPGTGMVQLVNLVGGVFQNYGSPISVYNWMGRYFDPAEYPNNELYVWVEQDTINQDWFLVSDEDDKVDENRVAYLRSVIPPCTVTDGDPITEPKKVTPGGPVTCELQRIDPISGDLVFDKSVPVYSWIRQASPDPASEGIDIGGYGNEDYVLRIFVNEDMEGNWWYIATDCVEPPPAAIELPSDGQIPQDGTQVIYVQ